MILETFDSTKKPLNDILKDISTGKTQLPDFQRSWVWDDERIMGLLASIAVSYPIGAIMLLETGNEDIRFKPRPIEGAKQDGYPEFFILDGQQRLTTLFQTLYTDTVVSTKDIRQKPIKRWFYFDIEKAISNELDIIESILSLPENKRLTKDFGREIIFSCETEEMEFKNLVFPINKLLNGTDWFNNYMKYWDYNQEKIKLFQKFQLSVMKRFEAYQLPVIKMFKHNPKEAVCQVFEKVNTGGVNLNVFELLTATFAADDFNLREDWTKRKAEFKSIDVISKLGNNEFLQAISLFSTIDRKKTAIAYAISSDKLPAVSCKKRDVLRISLKDYKTWSDLVTESFINAGKLLTKNKIFKSRDLPYTTQLVPLSVIMGLLGKKAENDGSKQKILKWYWNGILGELYGGANETRFAKDVVEVVAWIDGGSEPSTVRDAYFAEDRLWTLRTRNSAAYKGLFILQMQEGAKDFRTGDDIEWSNYYDDENIDIHHIFPQKWCEDHKIKPEIYNSIINKTPLSAKTNRMIGGKAPSLYLKTINKESEVSEDRVNDIMESHLIPVKELELDDFENFLNIRKENIVQVIEKVMGKSVQRENSAEDNEPN
jgi:hypothetical protein